MVIPMAAAETRTERRKAHTAAAIIGAAEQLFLGHGYRATTIEAVAEKADVALGTVYAHFDGKEGIYAALIDRALALDARYCDEGWETGTGPVERLRGLSGGYLRFAREHPGHFRVFRFPPPDAPTGGPVDAAVDRVGQRVRDETARIAGALEEAIAEGVVRPVDARTAATFLWTAWDGVIAAHILPRGEALSESDFDAVLMLGQEVLTRGLLAEGVTA